METFSLIQVGVIPCGWCNRNAYLYLWSCQYRVCDKQEKKISKINNDTASLQVKAEFLFCFAVPGRLDTFESIGRVQVTSPDDGVPLDTVLSPLEFFFVLFVLILSEVQPEFYMKLTIFAPEQIHLMSNSQCSPTHPSTLWCTLKCSVPFLELSFDDLSTLSGLTVGYPLHLKIFHLFFFFKHFTEKGLDPISWNMSN